MHVWIKLKKHNKHILQWFGKKKIIINIIKLKNMSTKNSYRKCYSYIKLKKKNFLVVLSSNRSNPARVSAWGDVFSGFTVRPRSFVRGLRGPQMLFRCSQRNSYRPRVWSGWRVYLRQRMCHREHVCKLWRP